MLIIYTELWKCFYPHLITQRFCQFNPSQLQTLKKYKVRKREVAPWVWRCMTTITSLFISHLENALRPHVNTSNCKFSWDATKWKRTILLCFALIFKNWIIEQIFISYSIHNEYMSSGWHQYQHLLSCTVFKYSTLERIDLWTNRNTCHSTCGEDILFTISLNVSW